MKQIPIASAARELIAVSRQLLGNGIDQSTAKMRVELFATACVESIEALQKEVAELRDQVNRLKPRE